MVAEALRRSFAGLPSLALALLGFAAQRSYGHETDGARRSSRCLVIDTDLDLDDSVALLYACLAGASDLRAVTLVGTGFWSDAPRATEFAQRLLSLCPTGNVPVALGRTTSLSGTDFHFPSAWSATAETFYQEALPVQSMEPRSDGSSFASMGKVEEEPSVTKGPSAAAQLILQTAAACHAEGRKLDIVSLAPLTNVAEALRYAPPGSAARAALGEVYFSGGNLDALLGNDADCGGTANTAECNVFVDAVAASEVFDSGLQVYVLDTMAATFLPAPTWLPALLEAELGPSATLAPRKRFVIGALRNFLATTTHPIFFYDPAVVVWYTNRQREALELPAASPQRRAGGFDDGDSFCIRGREMPVQVVLNSSMVYGSMVRGGNHSADFCWEPNATAFMSELFGVLLGPSQALPVSAFGSHRAEDKPSARQALLVVGSLAGVVMSFLGLVVAAGSPRACALTRAESIGSLLCRRRGREGSLTRNLLV